ncbi:hypothetical protein, partial [Enterococcus avium]
MQSIVSLLRIQERRTS